ncbi:aspartate--tRNA ligase [Flavobacteriaceae bacterium]|jgi:aspartyl-tRNA synthetase|nr:aspartate--tRNA ligase [Bacteroidota bacterium]MDB4134651.1 aspartate--tRNA ligase [Flavobacteriaceae bacterium]MDC0622237.1 aspartate--tRNA ligase [Flavobacteriaceae bacterium]
MYRTHNCGELRISDLGKQVTLSGWVQKSRDKGFMVWLDLRDRYGISQLIFDEERTSKEILKNAKSLGREFVIQIKGEVIERSSKNSNINTGDIEILVSELTILNESKVPPFTIEENTDGGEELRMQYRYLDIRRNSLKNNLVLRHKVTQEVRNYLSSRDFIEVETPYLIKSTPEGARDFVVPSRMNEGEFYALPQSPQTFKQLLMVGGLDKYFQIVKCFRDEDLRADRQPEFTQIDCEMSFVNQEDILNTFEGLTKHLIKSVKNIDILNFPRMTYDEAMEKYGCDKPDIRFGMEFGNLNSVTKHTDFSVFNNAEEIIGIAVPGGSSFTRKEIDKYIDWVKRPQIGASGMIYAKFNEDNTFKSSVDKFFSQEDLAKWSEVTDAKKGDIILVLSGEKNKVRSQLSALRLHVAENLGLRNPDVFAPLWVTDFPLLEWDEDSNKFHAMHHPFTSPKLDQIELLETNPSEVKANAYDLVLNGNEIGGGSIRIHDKKIQALMLKHLGFSDKDAIEQFGFLMNAFEYGAPPHGGIAFGLDRLVAILGGQETIRDFIAFPKNNSGRDIMINSPSKLDAEQLKELNLKINS